VTLLLVAAAVVISSLVTAAVLGAVRRVANWRRRRRECAPGTGQLRRIPRVAEAARRSRPRSWGWLVLEALGSAGPVAAPRVAEPATADQVQWPGSQLVRAAIDGNRFVLDCLVPPEDSLSFGVPMAVCAHCPPASDDVAEVDAAVRSWAATGAPVDIALSVRRGVAVVRLSAPDRELTLELDAPRAP
jgi:hypothetical protein